MMCHPRDAGVKHPNHHAREALAATIEIFAEGALVRAPNRAGRERRPLGAWPLVLSPSKHER